MISRHLSESRSDLINRLWVMARRMNTESIKDMQIIVDKEVKRHKEDSLSELFGIVFNADMRRHFPEIDDIIPLKLSDANSFPTPPPPHSSTTATHTIPPFTAETHSNTESRTQTETLRLKLGHTHETRGHGATAGGRLRSLPAAPAPRSGCKRSEVHDRQTRTNSLTTTRPGLTPPPRARPRDTGVGGWPRSHRRDF